MWMISSGIFLGWSLGANDSANVFGTGVTTGLIRYRAAVVLTALFLMFGALAEGPKCMDVVGDLSSIIPLEAFYCTLAAAVTMTILTCLALPASTSQAVIGAVAGAGFLSGSADISKLLKIVACWIFTPLGGILLGYALYRILRFLIDRTFTGLAHRSRIYAAGILFAGCYGAYSLGSNNVANVTGAYVGAGILSPGTASLIGGLSVAAGVLSFGKRVMFTVGKSIAPLDPFSALVVVLAEALTLHIFTQIGVPVSSSQAVVGAVVGVGIVGGLKTVNTKILLKISAGWLLTPVFSGLFSASLICWLT